MKKGLLLSILSLGVAMALLATNLGQHKPLTSSVVEAGANFVTVAAQQCLGPNDVRVGCAWVGYNEGPQWVDLSLSNNGFFPGTFVGLGPLAASQTSFTWDGILVGLTRGPHRHHWALTVDNSIAASQCLDRRHSITGIDHRDESRTFRWH